DLRRDAGGGPPWLVRTALARYCARNRRRGENFLTRNGVGGPMRREHLKARLLRAVSGKTQVRLAKEIDLPSSRLAQIEAGDLLPRRQELERMARNESLTVDDADEI